MSVLQFNPRTLMQQLFEYGLFIDLSHDIGNQPPCTLIPTGDNIPHCQVTTGEAVGVTFRTSIINNLHLNNGTHIDFPGHLQDINTTKKIGEYDIANFIAETVVIDVSHKVREISHWFKDSGELNLERLGSGEDFINTLFDMFEILEITKDDFLKLLREQGRTESDLTDKAVIFFTSLSKYWKNRIFNGWQYAYFINPYISTELADFLIASNIKMVGIDALQIENPIINLDGKEWMVILTQKYKKIVIEKLNKIKESMIHRKFLQNSILILENLKNVDKIVDRKSIICAVPPKLMLTGCTDNAIVRAFAIAFNK